MVYYWGHTIQKDNERLDKEYKLLQQHMKTTKNVSQVKRQVSVFLQTYMKIGEDPRDTVIRDKVWARLRKLTKNILTEEELDSSWNEATSSQNTFCTIQ
jgi:hypothetical protein